MEEALLSGQTKAWGWKNEECMYTQSVVHSIGMQVCEAG